LIDLDTGTTQSERSDLEFEVTAGSMVFYKLTPVKGAWLSPVSETEPGLNGCLHMQKDMQQDHGDPRISEGVYFCVLTNASHLAQIKVERYNPLGPYVLALEVSFITWAEIVPTPSR